MRPQKAVRKIQHTELSFSGHRHRRPSFKKCCLDKSEFGGSAALHFRALILWYKQRTFREAALEKKTVFLLL